MHCYQSMILLLLRSVGDPLMPDNTKTNLLSKMTKDYVLFIISHLWLTSFPRNTLFLWDTDTRGASIGDTADGETRSRDPSVKIRVI